MLVGLTRWYRGDIGNVTNAINCAVNVDDFSAPQLGFLCLLPRKYGFGSKGNHTIE